jgi:hypothetical protein
MFHSTILTLMLSALMPVCYPPLQPHESRSRVPPRWCPTASEHWWVPDVAGHLPRMLTPVPFGPAKVLKKPHKVAVLVSIVKHLSSDFARITTVVRNCRLSAVRDQHEKRITAKKIKHRNTKILRGKPSKLKRKTTGISQPQ